MKSQIAFILELFFVNYLSKRAAWILFAKAKKF